MEMKAYFLSVPQFLFETADFRQSMASSAAAKAGIPLYSDESRLFLIKG